MPNLMTLARVLLSIFVNIYILLEYGALTVPLLLTGLIVLSDFADGRLARATGGGTAFGALFDAWADLFYVLLSYAVMCHFHVLPVAGIPILLIHFAAFLVTSRMLRNRVGEDRVLSFNWAGRISALAFYALPMTAYVLHHEFFYHGPTFHTVVGVFLCLQSLMVLVSLQERVRWLARPQAE